MANCRGCNAEIEWFVNPKSGKKVPLDKEPRIMIVDPDGSDIAYDGSLDGSSVRGRFFSGQEKEGGAIKTVRVSHFKTCPAARQFSGRNK